MKLNKKNIALVAFSLVISNVTFAAGWSSTAKVDRVYNRAEGHVYVDFSGNGSNPDFCGKTGFYILDKNNPSFDNIYSAILAAKYSNRSISFYLNGCTADYPKILHSMNY
ncbi:hypothetical protein TDB9533_03785 [Thalassocella blandensis]|nr:hypothetical protein TDB9533_03785 [Thalassocella blandensis]